ncbi:hypothetical protein GCM10010350_22410 [Streptomyces galilaeus]|nr:hypothetical protein GCM10010350_22410 [Streptomyces galilaeus]
MHLPPAVPSPVVCLPARLGRFVQFALCRALGCGVQPLDMGADDGLSRIDTTTFTCLFCGLPQERVATLDSDWVMLEPGMEPLAHTVPAERRWITVSDGRVTAYGVCPPVVEQRCRIEHELACPGRALPDLWPWLTLLREENRRASERRDEPGPSMPPKELPATG